MTSQHSTGDTETLPEHWEMRVDSRTGMPYYLNHLRQFTTWDDPRQVQHPRGMLNDMGSMLRQRSASPNPPASWREMNEDGSTSIPFHHHFLAPTEVDCDQYSRSLPRPRRRNQSLFERGFPGDNWFKTRFDDTGDALFGASTLPMNSHSLRMRSQSPFGAGQRRSPPRDDFRKEMPTAEDSVTIPISKPLPNEPEGAACEERVIIPTQHKQHEDKDQQPLQDMKSRESPRPKLAKQEPSHAEDDENTDFHRSDSVYDNAQTIDEQEADDASSTSEALPDADSLTIEQTSSAEDEQTDAAPEEEEQEDSVDEELKAKRKQSRQAIEKIQAEVDGYRKEVEEFNDSKQSKQFRYLDEMLTRCQLALDNVETHGDIEIRKKRKETVNEIDSLLQLLENNCQS